MGAIGILGGPRLLTSGMYVSVEEVNGYLKRTKVGTRGMVYPSVYWPRVREGSFKRYLTRSVRADPIQHDITILRWWCTSFLGAT